MMKDDDPLEWDDWEKFSDKPEFTRNIQKAIRLSRNQ